MSKLFPVTQESIEPLIQAAKQHGEDDDPDHEVGDLQDYLRTAWRIMSPAQRLQFMKDDAVRDVAELETESLFEELDDALEASPQVIQPKDHSEAAALLDEADAYLRDIRAENLDGSEPELGELLEKNFNYFVQIGSIQLVDASDDSQAESEAESPQG